MPGLHVDLQVLERRERELGLAGGDTWIELGPAPIPNGQVSSGSSTVSGRVSSIAVHPTDPDTVYVGTAQGGVYRSLDGGATWTAIFETAETILEAVRISEKEDRNKGERRDRNDDSTPANRATRVTEVPEDAGIPIARHAEWDHIGSILRHDWTTIVEFKPRPAPSAAIDDILARYTDVEERIKRLVKAAKISRPVRMRRQKQGDRLDLDASIRAMILLDMIGAKDLKIDKETGYSAPWLTEIVWAQAKKLGHASVFQNEGGAIEDDHVAFAKAGVPTIDLIDLNNYPQWHTAEDDLSHVAARSLQIVGDVVMASLPEIEKKLASGK